MKVGDYVRINENVRKICIGIGKITNIVQSTIYVDMNNNLPISFERSEINKSSPNIIDLIEIGDYVNGHKVNYINKNRKHFNVSFGDEDFNLKSKFNSDIYWLSKEDIKSIVTKEQFSSMEYKI